MIKKVFSVLFTVLLLCGCVLFATAEHIHIYDDTDLISSQNENKCEDLCRNIEETYGFCVVFCLPADLGVQENVNAFCVDFYNTYVRTQKAIVCVRDLENQVFGYHIAGDSDRVFTDAVMEGLFDLYAAADTYAGGVEMFLTGVSNELAQSSVASEPSENAPSVQNAEDSSVAAAEPILENFAADYTVHALPLVVDKADLLTDFEENELEEKLYAVSFANNVDIVVLTVNSLDGKSSLAYADDYFDCNGYGQGEDRSGMLLLYLPGPQGKREVALSTSGELYDCVSDADSDALLDTIIPDLIDENYAAAFDNYVLFAQEQTQRKGAVNLPSPTYIPVCLLVGFAVAFIILKIQTASLKSVKKEKNARYYIKEGSLVLTGRHDRFLYKNVTKTAKQTQTSSSGTSGRISSSGARHGGTSRKF